MSSHPNSEKKSSSVCALFSLGLTEIRHVSWPGNVLECDFEYLTKPGTSAWLFTTPISAVQHSHTAPAQICLLRSNFLCYCVVLKSHPQYLKSEINSPPERKVALSAVHRGSRLFPLPVCPADWSCVHNHVLLHPSPTDRHIHPIAAGLFAQTLSQRNLPHLVPRDSQICQAKSWVLLHEQTEYIFLTTWVHLG